ncbi:uncharacterized protein [Chironomus tepperi]|uniref:uncharacterized protein isoform X2 n=1 Tax=Chironomus tepperi TaxID=113505 RepID=UPI00391F41DF
MTIILNHELNIVQTLVHYFLRDNKIVDLKNDPILKDLFCQLFQKLFITSYEKNRPKGSDLDFFMYVFIFKIWHYVCSSTEEKHKIERLIPLLYKFDTTLSSFIISKKYVTHTYHDNGLRTINNIKERILKMLKTEESVFESSNQIETKNLRNTPYFHIYSPYKVKINWLEKLTNRSEDTLVENSDGTDFLMPKHQTIAPNISNATTIRVSTPEITQNNSDMFMSSNQLSSNNIGENISSVSTVQLHYPENAENRQHEVSDATTLSVLDLGNLIEECPSSLSYRTAINTKRVPSNISQTSTVYLSCPDSQNETISKTINPNSANSSSRLSFFPKISKGMPNIRIIERKDYIERGNSRKRTFSMYRDECLVSKQKRISKPLENGWAEVKQCSVQVKKLDSFEIEAFKNKKLPLEYFTRTYSNKSSNDEQRIECTINFNDSNISTEILEETLGSRAYLYCREIQKTLENELKNGRKRAKSCFNY